tara:strand:- start:370 stop:969 length:600 start_codon:yes stop_codon:yes gene_type:complete
MKKKIFITFLGLIIITGCATNNASSNKKSASSSNKTVECIEVGSYDNSDLDNFLQSSYDNCNLLASKVEKLDEINDFVEDPSGWMATEVNKATSPYKQQLKSAAYIASNRDEAMKALKIAFVKRINDEILKELKSALEDANNKLSGSSNALSSAKGLSGMNKLSAAKDVANATKNYKATIALIQELQAQASRLVNNLKV